MNFNEIVKNHRKKLEKEAFFRSLFFGLTMGALSLLVCSFLFWFFNAKLFWIGFIVMVPVTALATFLIYKLKYRPDDKQIAKRCDELGLEERVITMNELKDDDSLMARLQRQDTQIAIGKFNQNLIKFSFSTLLIIGLSLSVLSGSAMTVVSALSANGVIGGGKEIIDPTPVDPEHPTSFEISYEVFSGEGYIEGDLFQIVDKGMNGFPVLAVPADGFIFVKWSDGNEDPYRVEYNVEKSMKIFAMFTEASEGSGSGSGEPGDESDDTPKDPDGEGNTPADDGDEGEGAGGKYEPANQVYDGETFYGGKVYDEAYEAALEELSQDGSKSDEDTDFINTYYKTIAK